MASRFTRCMAGAFLLLLGTGAAAQSFPSKPFRAIIPYGPGTGVDVVAQPPPGRTYMYAAPRSVPPVSSWGAPATTVLPSARSEEHTS